jgi:putative transcriptional regulator
MPIKYKIDVLAALKEKGYNTTRLRREKLLSEGAIQSLRSNAPVSFANLSKLCKLLNCQPGDIMEYKESTE